jgi:hypothetical protein
MEELERHGKLGLAALRAGMHRNTARRYRDLGRAPRVTSWAGRIASRPGRGGRGVLGS